MSYWIVELRCRVRAKDRHDATLIAVGPSVKDRDVAVMHIEKEAEKT